MKGENKDDIEAKLSALSEATGGLAQKMYAEEAQNAAGATDGAAGPTDAGAQADSPDDVVDAEFEEVKDADGKSRGS